jgi:hypothetical protein
MTKPSGGFMSSLEFKSFPAFHSSEDILAHPHFAFARDEL